MYIYIYYIHIILLYNVIFSKWPPSKLPNPMSHPPCSPPAHSRKSEEIMIYPISQKSLAWRAFGDKFRSCWNRSSPFSASRVINFIRVLRCKVCCQLCGTVSDFREKTAQFRWAGLAIYTIWMYGLAGRSKWNDPGGEHVVNRCQWK